MTALRVLFLRNCRGITDITGSESYLLSVVPRLQSVGCETMVACIIDPRRGETAWLKAAKSCGLPMTTIPVANRLSGRDLLSVIRLIRQYKVDVVHTLDHRADFVGVLAAWVTGRPVVAFFSGWTNWPSQSLRGRIYPWIDRHVLKHADAVLSDSASMAAQIDQGSAGPPVVIVPNGVDTSVFHPDVTPSIVWESAEERRPFVLGMVGRIHPNKGQLEFLKAAVGLRQIHPRCRFLIVGEAPPGYETYKKDVLNFIEVHGMADVVTVTKATREQIPGIMASLDILVAPSVTESFSITMIEAMASGKPIVATNAGGTPELIRDEETGVLIDSGDAETLTRALHTLMTDPAKMERLGKAARAVVLNQLSIDVMVARLRNIYKEVIAWRNQRGGADSNSRSLDERLRGALVVARE